MNNDLFDKEESPRQGNANPSPEAYLFIQAQAGCRECLDELMARHDGLAYAIVRRQRLGDMPFAEALQAARIGLWRAIMRYDPHRRIAFSTYAWVSIHASCVVCCQKVPPYVFPNEGKLHSGTDRKRHPIPVVGKERSHRSPSSNIGYHFFAFDTLNSGLRDETFHPQHGIVGGVVFQYPQLGSTR